LLFKEALTEEIIPHTFWREAAKQQYFAIGSSGTIFDKEIAEVVSIIDSSDLIISNVKKRLSGGFCMAFLSKQFNTFNRFSLAAILCVSFGCFSVIFSSVNFSAHAGENYAFKVKVKNNTGKKIRVLFVQWHQKEQANINGTIVISTYRSMLGKIKH